MESSVQKELAPAPEASGPESAFQDTVSAGIKSPVKNVLKTSLPAVVDLSSQTIYWTIEAIFIGKISMAAFAGVGMAIQIITVFFAVLLTFVVGASLIINRHLGAGEKWEANHILGQTMMIAITMAFLFGLLWYSGAIHLFKVIREVETREAQEAGITYLRTVALFAPFIITNFIATGIIRGSGDTTFSMLVNVTINVLSLILAPLLIFGLLGLPRLGVRGAALAVGMAHSCGWLITFYLLRSRRCLLFLSFRELTTPNFTSFKRLFNAGLPTTIEQLVWALGQLIVTSFAGIIGVTILTTHTVFVRIQAVLSMMYMGFSLAAMTLVGKDIGAARHHLAEKTASAAGRVVFVFVLSVALFLIIFDRQIIYTFTSASEVIGLGSRVMLIFAAVQIVKAMNSVVSGNLRGAGDLKWLMWITTAMVLFLEIGLNWICAFIFGFGLYGIWIVQFFDELLRTIINHWRFKGGKWKILNI